MSEWIEWHGGACPVLPDVQVEVEYRDECDGERVKGYAKEWNAFWRNGTICRYRIISQDSELDRLRKENAALRGAFEALSHAFAEVSHAYCNPRWFTGGHEAANAHIYRWLSDGGKIIDA